MELWRTTVLNGTRDVFLAGPLRVEMKPSIYSTLLFSILLFSRLSVFPLGEGIDVGARSKVGAGRCSCR